MIYAIVALWIAAALLATKLDAVWTKQPTHFGNFVISLFFWPIAGFFMVITKHPISQIQMMEDY